MDSRKRGRAAQYVRMSTEHQRYSIEGQTITNVAYAAEHGYQIVRTFADAGISGLTLSRRAGLKALLAEVLNGEADFEVILVYDVSRWGRFQDPDQSAHYEFICREAGVNVQYTAEPFDNDGSLTSTLVKHLKRAMAAEYSRELSVKVTAAKRSLRDQGFWCGSSCCYGFRRQIVHPDGSVGDVLEHGERKQLQGYRTRLVAGPASEVETVRRIFREYGLTGLSTSSIAQRLNAEGVPASRGQPWVRNRVYRLLTDEKYAGVVVSARRATRLSRHLDLPRAEWRRVAGACPALVDRPLFDIVQRNIRNLWGSTADEVLEHLRSILARRGMLSASIIRDEGPYGVGHVTKHFGSLGAAYDRLGYIPDNRQMAGITRGHRPPPRPWNAMSTDAMTARLRELAREHGHLTQLLIDRDPELPSATTCKGRYGGMPGLWEAVGYTPKPNQRCVAPALRRRPREGMPGA